MNPENNVIKSITMHTCPNCQQDIYVENQMTPPVVSALFTPADVFNAKEECLKRIKDLSLPEEKLDSVLKWINDSETIFGPEEVPSIIEALIKPE